MTSKRQRPDDDEINKIADDFATREFSADELASIKKSRRRTPTIGDAAAEVVTFRAPPAYKDRMPNTPQRARSSEMPSTHTFRQPSNPAPCQGATRDTQCAQSASRAGHRQDDGTDSGQTACTPALRDNRHPHLAPGRYRSFFGCPVTEGRICSTKPAGSSVR
jgi:hypothetical protein